MPNSATEIVLATALEYEPDWKVDSVEGAVDGIVASGGRMIVDPCDVKEAG